MGIVNRSLRSCCAVFAAALIGCNAVSAAPTQADTISGQYCVGPATGHSAFQLFSALPAQDGSIDFGISIWDDRGRNCGVTGNAVPANNGWRYEQNMDSANEAERCAIDITLVDNTITVNADPAASCMSACGVNISISNAIFPAASRQPTALISQDLEPEIFFNTTCPSSSP